MNWKIFSECTRELLSFEAIDYFLIAQWNNEDATWFFYGMEVMENIDVSSGNWKQVELEALFSCFSRLPWRFLPYCTEHYPSNALFLSRLVQFIEMFVSRCDGQTNVDARISLKREAAARWAIVKNRKFRKLNDRAAWDVTWLFY